ncbi:hypothetical protein [Moorena sp. SIO2C4]|uniref:hypothetical protein n=1 Tax=Moorena sp. SIO2C4 TaxID=2607824 RepID=UPI0013C567DA|nr:hypothetical protein [Moorena sp. SIO2C4]NES40336.1 hypothetical protein [Moorena sp. SIO2C4]
MSIVLVKLTLSDKLLEDERLQEETQYLLEDIKQEVEVEDARLAPIENLEKHTKSLGGFLLGVLTAEVNLKNFKSLMRFMSDRLRGKVIELKVTANGKSLTVKASNQAELLAAIKAAQDFIGE